MAILFGVRSARTRVFIGEFIGTLCFMIGLTLGVTSSDGSLLMIAMAASASVTIGVFLTFNVSGGQLNPAVTFALALLGKIDTITAATNTIAQVTGAIAGVGIANVIHANLLGALSVPFGISTSSAFFAETVGTFVLCFTVLATAIYDTNKQAPMVIGGSVFAMHFALLTTSGCGLNPARFLGTAVVLKTWPTVTWVYLIAPFAGAIITVPFVSIMYNTDAPIDKAAEDAALMDPLFAHLDLA